MEQIAFARGVPSPEALPVDQLREAAERALRNDAHRVLSYGTGGGYPPLREMLAERHGVKPSQVLISTGSLQAFVFLTAQLMGSAAGHEHGSVIVENPTYDRPLLLLRQSGVNVHGIRVDDEGLDVDQLEHTLSTDTPSLLYVIPNFQNPSGATLSEPRRQRLLDLAERHDLLVLEDDPYGDLWFDTPPPATLFSRQTGAHVIYASSFSKTVSPGLRVGYLVLPEHLAGGIETIANNTYISPSLLGQAVVAEFLAAGLLQPNIDRCRELLLERCDAMCEALDEHLPELEYTRPGGGYFLWGRLPGGTSSGRLLSVAAGHGVTFVPGSSFGDGQDDAVRLAFSYPSVDEVREGVRRLGEAFRDMLTVAG